jgi:hypothetical protein
VKQNVVLFLAALLVLSCGNPVHERAPERATLRVLATLPASEASRTVVPNFQAQVDDIVVHLTSKDGYDSPPDQHATGGPSSWTASFNVPVGNWDVSATAYLAGVQVGSGSALNQPLTAASALAVTIPITIGGSGGVGSVNFALSFPDSLGIDYVHGQIDGGADLTPVLSSSGGFTRGVLAFSGLSTNTYSLVLTFKRGGASGKGAGVFREKLVVTAPFQSGSWVNASGNLVSERAFAANEFFENNAALSNLLIDGGVFTSGFDSSKISYPQGPIPSLPTTVSVTAIGSIAGQYLEAKWISGAFTELPNGTPWTSPATAEDNTLVVRVTAPDHATTKEYTVTFSKGYRVTYNGNGGAGSAPVDSTVYGKNGPVTIKDKGTLTRSGWTFINWNTQADGFGTSYAVGYGFPMGTADLPLYAHWVQNGTVNVTCLLNPTYKSITFYVPSVTVSRSGQLSITGSPSSGATNWNWYLDNAPLASNTASSYTWNVPSNQQPGHYTINVDALYYDPVFKRNIACTGSFRVTVTY